jgi:ketosteroid isomerase-like protein
MTPKETIKALYAAYASGDAARIADLLHDDVVWVAPAGNATQVALGIGRADEAGAPRGTNNLGKHVIVQFMAYNFARLFSDVKNEFRSLIGEGPLVMVEHRLSATLANGRSYMNDYCFAFEVQDGRVRQIREYMDTRGGWAQVFGDGAPETIVPFVER